MRNLLILLTLSAMVALAGCATPDAPDEEDTGQQAEPATAGGPGARATIEARSDSGVSGEAVFTSEGDAVKLVISIQGATPGEHAFHLHEIGDCSSPDGKSAGGHWNPTGADHGKWGAEAYHLGDVGNIMVAEDGTGSYELTSSVWSIGTGADNDVVGRAVIVHAGVDDFTSQPTGAAGGRIGCGVIELSH